MKLKILNFNNFLQFLSYKNSLYGEGNNSILIATGSPGEYELLIKFVG